MSVVGQKTRGRRPKPKVPFFAASKTTQALDLSERIAGALGAKRCKLTDKLAEAALSFEAFAQVQKDAPLAVKRRGNRPNIHLALLLADCARAYEAETGKDSRKELQRIGERTEANSEVVRYVRAVLQALDINHPFSLRQQAKQAVKYL